jgi:hypothetical protein
MGIPRTRLRAPGMALMLKVALPCVGGEVVAPKLELAFEAAVDVGDPVEVGAIPGGTRRVVPINGGTFSGPMLRGTILPGGADYQLLQTDGSTQLDAHYVLQTDNGSRISVVNRGIRHGSPEVMTKLNAGEPVDPNLIYFRTAAQMQTAAPELQWMNHSLFIGVGERYPSKVVVQFFRII